MTKFLKTKKGSFYIDNERVTKAHFLSQMLEENRKTYIKESKKGNYYYSLILKSEMSFILTSKVMKSHIWDFYTYNKQEKVSTHFYAIEEPIDVLVFEDSQYLANAYEKFNKIVEKMIKKVKTKYKLKTFSCRAIVDVDFTKKEKTGKDSSFMYKFSSLGYKEDDTYQEMFINPSIVRIVFTRLNLLCVQY